MKKYKCEHCKLVMDENDYLKATEHKCVICGSKMVERSISSLYGENGCFTPTSGNDITKERSLQDLFEFIEWIENDEHRPLSNKIDEIIFVESLIEQHFKSMNITWEGKRTSEQIKGELK